MRAKKQSVEVGVVPRPPRSASGWRWKKGSHTKVEFLDKKGEVVSEAMVPFELETVALVSVRRGIRKWYWRYSVEENRD